MLQGFNNKKNIYANQFETCMEAGLIEFKLQQQQQQQQRLYLTRVALDSKYKLMNSWPSNIKTTLQ